MRYFASMGCVVIFFASNVTQCKLANLPNPSPTPSPSPTASPTATPTPTPTPSASTSSTDNSAQVASTTASIMQATAQNALTASQNFQQALTALIGAPTQDNYTTAKTLLDASRKAFLQAEIAVYFVNPSVPAEVAALPDPANVEATNGGTSFDALEDLLAQYFVLISANTSADAQAQSLQTETQTLVANLQNFTNAWSTSNAADFSNQFFLSSSDDAVARVFQGMTIFTGIVLPRNVQGKDAAGADTGHPLSSIEALSGLLGVQDLYSGSYLNSNGSQISGTGLEAFIEQADPTAAQAIQQSILNAMDIAQQLGSSSNDSAIRQALVTALDTLNQQLNTAYVNSGL